MLLMLVAQTTIASSDVRTGPPGDELRRHEQHTRLRLAQVQIETPVETGTITIIYKKPIQVVVLPPELPDGEVDYEYRSGEKPVQLVANGGTAPYKFRVIKGRLPPGLTLSSRGLLNGEPVQKGTFGFTVRATDKNRSSGTRAYTIAILEPPPPCDWPNQMLNGVCTPPPKIAIYPSTLPDGETEYDYRAGEASVQLAAKGGAAPYRFRVTKGRLPPGLRLSRGGLIDGVPTRKGTYGFTVRANDKKGFSGRHAYTIQIIKRAPVCDWPNRLRDGVCMPPPVKPPTISISPPELSDGKQNSPYPPVQLVANGGTRPHTFALAGGKLPPGLALSTAGLLAGMPTQSGAFGFTVRATDRMQFSGIRAYSISILDKPIERCLPPKIIKDGLCLQPPKITISPSELPGGPYDSTFSTTQLVANGGARPHTFAVADGKLPSGLTLSSTGQLSGTLLEKGSFTVRVTDAQGFTGSHTYSISIVEQPAVEPCPAGMVRFGANCVTDGSQVRPPPKVISKRPCPEGSYRFRGKCKEYEEEVRPRRCRKGTYRNKRGKCVRRVVDCRKGYYRNRRGKCVKRVVDCRRGYYRNRRGRCVKKGPVYRPCPRMMFRRNGQCVCAGGLRKVGNTCERIIIRDPPRQPPPRQPRCYKECDDCPRVCR
jgi:Putative Ig domain